MKHRSVDICGTIVEVAASTRRAINSLFRTVLDFQESMAKPPDWRIEVEWADAMPPRPAGTMVFATTLKLDDTTRVEYSVAENGVLYASMDSAMLLIQPDQKRAVLRVHPTAVAGAEKLARLAIIELLRREGRYVMHTGAVELGGGAVLLCAPSGLGKSTMTTAWACLGNARFMADDRCVLFRHAGAVWAWGVPTIIALLPDAEALMQQFGIRMLPYPEAVRGKKFYDPLELFIDTAQEPSPVRAIFFLTNDLTPADSIKPCPPDATGRLLLESCLYAGEPNVVREQFATILDLASQAPAYLIPARIEFQRFVDEAEGLLGSLPFTRGRHPALCYHRCPPLLTRDAVRAAENLCRALSPKTLDNLGQMPAKAFRDMAAVAVCHGLLPLLGRTLETRNFLEQLDTPLASALRGSIGRAQEARVQRTGVLDLVANALRAVNVAWVAASGPSVAERLYAYPESRLYDHIDMIVAPSSASETVRTLTSIGFAEAVIPPHGGGSVVFEEHTSGFRVHMHTGYGFRDDCFDSHDVRPLLGRAENIQPGSTPIPVPTLTDQFILTCLNRQQGDLRSLLDISLMVARFRITDSDVVIREVMRLGVAGSLGVTLRQALSIFPVNGSSCLPQRLAPSLWRRLANSVTEPRAHLLVPWRTSRRTRMKIVHAPLG